MKPHLPFEFFSGDKPLVELYVPLCPQARLPETKDTKGAAHRQAGPQVENSRSEKASHTQGTHSTG